MGSIPIARFRSLHHRQDRAAFEKLKGRQIVREPGSNEFIPAESPSPDTAVTPSVPSAETVYADAIVEMKSIFTAFEKKQTWPDDVRSVAGLARAIAANDQELLMLSERTTPDTYLIGHAVNVCIFALLIGHAKGLDTDQLHTLGICALLHDLGLAGVQPQLSVRKKYSPAELSPIQLGSLAGGAIVNRMPGLSEEVKALLVTIVGQVHERADGTGYPFGIRGPQIHPFARMIAIADVYESLTHPRPFRERTIPHIALKQMIHDEENTFDNAFLKLFIERMSLYPPGSYVLLNTEEIGRVVEAHTGIPTRPKVRILIGPDKARVPGIKIVDLLTTPMVCISDAVDELALDIPDKKLLLELKAIRWWVRGL